MDFYYAGAEQPLYLRQLHALGVNHVAISFFEWRRRHSSDALYRHIPEDVKVCITAGVSLKKDIDFKAFGNDYIEFCEKNAEDALIYGMDAAHAPLAVQRAVRNQLSVLPNMVAFPIGEEEPSSMTVEFERIGINATLGKSLPMNELKRLQATLYGSNITDPRKLRDGRFAATTSTAWMSPLRYGQLWVFSNNKLSHYKAESLERAVRAHRGAIEAYGIDPAACAANDHRALTELAVISLREMAESLTKRRRDNQNVEAAAASTSPARERVPNARASAPAGPSQEIAQMAAALRETVVLPVISMNEQDGVRKVQLNSASLRLCDSCNLSEVCPGYEPLSTCKYSVPVEIKTKEQWQSAAQVLLEAQFQRVAHGVFVEQTDGGDLTPRVGQEMDRFFKMLTSIKELETKPDDGASGPMTRFFQQAQAQIGDGNDEADGEEDEDDDAIEGEVVGDAEEAFSDFAERPA